MNPIEISVCGIMKHSPETICREFLNVDRWSEFAGYSILPGIKRAVFEQRIPSIVGSRIRVNNTDGSSHIEEIVEWNEGEKVCMKFQEFSTPLNKIAEYFLEEWRFEQTNIGTKAIRKMKMYPKGIAGWMLLLTPISLLMKKAFERQVIQMNMV